MLQASGFGRQVLALALSLNFVTPCRPGEPEVAAAWRAGDFQRAVRELLPMVNAGDKWAAGQLGRLYFDGAGVPKDLERARKLLLQSEGFGQLSDIVLADMLMKGYGGEADTAKAGVVLKRWVDLPSASSTTQLSYVEWLAWYSPAESRLVDFRFTAIEYAKRAAAAGDKLGYYWLGMLYASEATIGPPRSQEQLDSLMREALSWHRRAGIEGGHLGSMAEYARWCFIDKSPEATATVARFAQAQSVPNMSEYAFRLQRGIGTRKDPDAAVKWARVGGARADPQSLYVLGAAHRRGLGEQLDATKAIDLLTQAAAKRHSLAFAELAGIYMDGKLVQADLVTARDWLVKGFDRAGNRHDREMYAGALREFDRIKAQADVESRQSINRPGSADPVTVAFMALLSVAVAVNRPTDGNGSTAISDLERGRKESDEFAKQQKENLDTMWRITVLGL